MARPLWLGELFQALATQTRYRIQPALSFQHLTSTNPSAHVSAYTNIHSIQVSFRTLTYTIYCIVKCLPTRLGGIEAKYVHVA